VHGFESALTQWRERVIADPPDVLMLDGIWFSTMQATGECGTDRKGRRRPVQKRIKRVALIALGLWSDSGRKQILDFEIADSEEEGNCLPLLNRLHWRGVTDGHLQLVVSDGAGGLCAAIETVYPTVARQRCVFHKLKNVGDHLRDKTHRKAILEAACWIYDASNPREAHARLEHFVMTWQGEEPEAVTSLRADFEASIAYLSPLHLEQPRRYRTTNAMEGGVMRPLRRTLDRATAFRSATGAQVGLFLAMARLNATQRDTPWVYETDDIITMLYNSKP
jgi:transposase-like protein